MLTRIELDGFKTFDQFGLDVGPLLVILGTNASGKSNLFDALQLLSRLAEYDLAEALRELRGEPRELFRWSGTQAPAGIMVLSAEVLLEPTVTDAWGARQTLRHTRVRYEVKLERRGAAEGLERVVVAEERATPILSRDDEGLRGRSSGAFRQAYLRYKRQKPLLSTELEGGRTEFHIHQDGHQGRNRPAAAAERTVLSSITSAEEFPHLFALREEFRSWRLLRLKPDAIRLPSDPLAPDRLRPDGGNLAKVLARIQAETRTEAQPRGRIAEIVAGLSSLVPGVRDIQIQLEGSKYRLEIVSSEDGPVSAALASDGTLRVLALLTLLLDPQHRGTVLLEEPENGVHPARLKDLIRQLSSHDHGPKQR